MEWLSPRGSDYWIDSAWRFKGLLILVHGAGETLNGAGWSYATPVKSQFIASDMKQILR
jgi:hypothetical protein